MLGICMGDLSLFSSGGLTLDSSQVLLLVHSEGWGVESDEQKKKLVSHNKDSLISETKIRTQARQNKESMH